MKPIIRIITVLLIGGGLSWTIATPISLVIYKYRHSDQRHLTELYENNTPYDMLFIGSSRTHRSINPQIIDSICGVNSYNAGVESGSIADFEITLKGYLTHHPAPKSIVLTLDLHSLSKPCQIFYYPQYYPYLDNAAIDQTLIKYGCHTNIIKLFPFLMITDLDDFTKENAIQLLRGRDTLDIPEGDFDYKGYISNGDKYIEKEKLEQVIKVMSICDEAIASLEEILDICKEKNIDIIFTYAPEYNFNLQKRRTNVNEIFNYITLKACKNHIPYLRNDSLELCKNPRFFANNGHLNKSGAIVYSAILAKQLNALSGHNIETKYSCSK